MDNQELMNKTNEEYRKKGKKPIFIEPEYITERLKRNIPPVFDDLFRLYYFFYYDKPCLENKGGELNYYGFSFFDVMDKSELTPKGLDQYPHLLEFSKLVLTMMENINNTCTQLKIPPLFSEDDEFISDAISYSLISKKNLKRNAFIPIYLCIARESNETWV